MQPVYGGQSDVDIGLSAVYWLHAGCMSIVKYTLNEHAHSRRILPSSFSIYIHRPPASTNQTVHAYLSLRQTPSFTCCQKPQHDAHLCSLAIIIGLRIRVACLVKLASILENNSSTTPASIRRKFLYFVSGKQIHYQSVVGTSHWPLQYPRFRPYQPFLRFFFSISMPYSSISNHEKSTGSHNSCPAVRRHFHEVYKLCMQTKLIDSLQLDAYASQRRTSVIDAGLSGECSLHAGCMSIVKYTYTLR